MPKVVTSEGIQDFVASGKHEVIAPDKAKTSKDATPLEVIKPPVVADIGEKTEKVEKTAEKADEADEDKTPVLSEDSRKYVNKQHRLRKEAEEKAAEADRFAENQYNRARLAEERAAKLEAELQERQKVATPEATRPVHDEKGPDGTPKWYDEKGQFKAFEYAEALSAYSAAKAVADDRKKQVEEAQKAATAAAEEAAKSRVAESRKLHEDYDEVIAGADVKTHSAVLQYMSASENIGEIAYYLATNPAYVERLNKLNPLKAIAEIGKLELTFEKKPEPNGAAPPKAGAPPPIAPLPASGSGIIETNPAKMTFRQLREYERQRAQKRH